LAGARPQTPLGSLQRSPDLLAVFKLGALLLREGDIGREGKAGEWEEGEGKEGSQGGRGPLCIFKFPYGTECHARLSETIIESCHCH